MSQKDRFRSLIDAEIDDEKIGGWVGLPTAAIEYLAEHDHLPPTLAHERKFFFEATVEGMRLALNDDDFTHYLNNNFREDYSPKEGVKAYAYYSDSEDHALCAIGIDPIQFRRSDRSTGAANYGDTRETYQTVKEYFDEEIGDSPHNFYHLLIARGLNEGEIQEIYEEAIKRKGVILALSIDLCEKVRGQIESGESKNDEEISLFLRTPNDRSIGLEYILSIQPQCKYSRARINALLNRLC